MTTQTSPHIAVTPERAMARALVLARRGLGAVHPNPPVGAVLVGHHDPTGLRFAGRVGSGLTQPESRALIQLVRPTDRSPFVDDVPPVPGRTITFVEPELVVEVAFGEWTPDGNLRHPVYLGRRPDVDPANVPREPDPHP